MTAIPAASRGVLYPASLPTFHRELATGELADFVRWFWIPEWDIEPGRSSRQHLIGYPACNLVVEDTRAEVHGPTTRVSHRDLSLKGWAVGALLRPAAVPSLVPSPSALVDTYRELHLPELAEAVRVLMTMDVPSAERHSAAIEAFSAWLLERLGTPSEEALLANRMVEAAETNRALTSVADLAAHLHVSARTLQRLAATYVGVSPGVLIRRRRLQEAAAQLRKDPRTDLSELAYDLGYADHAHLTNDFRTTLGFTPSSYRGSTTGHLDQ